MLAAALVGATSGLTGWPRAACFGHCLLISTVLGVGSSAEVWQHKAARVDSNFAFVALPRCFVLAELGLIV